MAEAMTNFIPDREHGGDWATGIRSGRKRALNKCLVRRALPPHPGPLPQGEGDLRRRAGLLSKRSAVRRPFASPKLAPRFSLSLRERAGVRGKGIPWRARCLGFGACLVGALTVFADSAFAASKLTDLKVFPPEVRLSAKQDRQSLVVQATSAEGATRDVTDAASFAFADKAVARFEKGSVLPLADGKTELQVKFDGRTLSVPVNVTNAKTE